ncbi:MAG: NAD-dependent epimerase/dehydratase family protein [Hyphomicrobiales bacterium]
MAILVTGAAGFIGFHVTQALLQRGEHVVGIDNLNAYYDVALKKARLEHLSSRFPLEQFTFHELDISDENALKGALKDEPVTQVVHLAAQAGVRYSLENPRAYEQSNLAGHLNILEYCRHNNGLHHLVYASSSSVYGGNTKLPFSEKDPVDNPVSLYAATKKANELMSQAYANLYGFPQTGLRFFTVYGPWGRPDMAYWLFADAISQGKPIKVFNNGEMARDFTYIDDIVSGVLAVLASPSTGLPPHRVYNIGNNHPEPLMKLITLLEDTLDKKAEMQMHPMQPGDVKETYADIDAIKRDHGFAPTTSLEDGIAKFANWFKGYKKIN